jgi:hypothetical protein
VARAAAHVDAVVGVRSVADDLVLLLAPGVHGVERERDVLLEARRVRRRLDRGHARDELPADVVAGEEVARKPERLEQELRAAAVDDNLPVE